MTTPDTFGSASDRLLVAVLVALVLHSALILGIRFKTPRVRVESPTLDVELIQDPNGKRPDKADYRSQENNLGGSPQHKNYKPKPLPHAVFQPPEKPQPRQVHERSRLQGKKKPMLTRQQAEVAVDKTMPKQATAEPHLDPRRLARQIAELGVAPTRKLQFSQERVLPINKISTQKHIAAAYERAWQEKVERIGNLNYPDEARRKGLTGHLLISVYVAQNGSVKKIKIHRSSGHRILDDAAVRIVRLAAPFAPFPRELAQQADALVITRNWKFYNEAGLAMGR